MMEKQVFITRVSSPTIEQQHNEDPIDIDDAVSTSWCGCFFGVPCFRRNRDAGESRGLLHQQNADCEETWFVRKFKRLKEASEVLAGPQWKNFIRRIGKHFGGGRRRRARAHFKYDPHSYALNFDDGGIDDGEDDDLLVGFSSRFAPPVSSGEERRSGL